VRRWIGARIHRDRPHHLIGGGLLTGVALDESAAHAGNFQGGRMFLLPQRQGRARAYVVISPQRLAEHQPHRSPDAFLAVCASVLPPGALDSATVAGPVAFFPNADVWAAPLTAPGVVLIGDAAGANDPSVGNGLSLVFRDVRTLRDALRSTAGWDEAARFYAECRQRDFAVLRAHARWLGILTTEEGEEADARRERVARARELDPAAGGFGLIFARGPDGLVADDEARRHFFGEDLVANATQR
jgi:2-polyprenyl-6-methoxyphenol hydroxylase-like FAD-dependent oxidoreductase